MVPIRPLRYYRVWGAMGKVVGLIAVTLVVLATALHLFYVDYEVDGRGYIVSWAATTAQRQELASQIARERVIPPRRILVENPPLSQRIRQLRRFQQENCTDRNGRPVGWDIEFFEDLVCRTQYEPPKVTRKATVVPGVTYEQALQIAQSELNRREILFGARPSRAFAGARPSKASVQKAFWIGILLPFVLLAGGACALVLGCRSGVSEYRSPTSSIPHTDPAESARATRANLGRHSLAQMLLTDLGDDFPVASGNGKKNDPLVITAQADYVSVEYAVVRHVLRVMREEFQLSSQTLVDDGGRKIDQLVFDVKPAGADGWSGQRRFFFDITAGYGRVGNS